MATQALFVCKHCKKRSFSSQKGLDQHIARDGICSRLAREALARRERARYLVEGTPPTRGRTGPGRGETAPAYGQNGPDTRRADETGKGQKTSKPVQTPPEEEESEDNQCFNPADSSDPSSSDDSSSATSSSDSSSQDPSHVAPISHGVSTVALYAFHAFLDKKKQNNHAFTTNEQRSILLMDVVKSKRATLDTYESVLEWHLKSTGELSKKKKLGDYPHYISRQKMWDLLKARYHGPANLFEKKRVTLPVSKTKVDLIMHDARDCIVRLLTDPRFCDEDFLHFSDDPTAPLPAHLDHLADINTGRGYRETHKKLIKDPTKQLLVPIIQYIDGAISGQFGKLSVEALKVSLGILNFKARERAEAWAILGFVPNYHKSKTRGEEILVDSGHVAGTAFDHHDEDGNDALDWECPPEQEPGNDSGDDEVDALDDGEDPMTKEEVSSSEEEEEQELVQDPDDFEYDDEAHENQD
jgi:hypothetical protein